MHPAQYEELKAATAEPTPPPDDPRTSTITNQNISPRGLPTADDPLLNSRKVCARFGTTTMSLWRWERTLGFPAPLKIGDRNYWRLSDIEKWWNDRVASGAFAEVAKLTQRPPPPPPMRNAAPAKAAPKPKARGARALSKGRGARTATKTARS
jgi:predicted DNA-binding transcriptional regulator AlpA